MEAVSYQPSTGDVTALVAGGGILSLLYFGFLVLMIVAGWKIFEKAGEEGWKVLVPFYNTYTLFKIAGRNGWGFLLLFIPVVNFVVTIILAIDLAKHFGKSTTFGVVGLWLFNVIGALMLGFGKAEYVGPKHA